MMRKKRLIAVIAVIVIIALAFVGYNIYRYPAMFRSLEDNSLNDSQAMEVQVTVLPPIALTFGAEAVQEATAIPQKCLS